MSVNEELNKISQEHILAAIRALDEGVQHLFADSTTYDVLYEGCRYPPKAVLRD